MFLGQHLSDPLMTVNNTWPVSRRNRRWRSGAENESTTTDSFTTLTMARYACRSEHPRDTAMVPYVVEWMVLYSEEERLSIGRPVSEILASEKRRHGRPAAGAHTQFRRLF